MMSMMSMMIYDRFFGILNIKAHPVYQFHHSSDKDRQSILTTQDTKITKPHEEVKDLAEERNTKTGTRNAKRGTRNPERKTLPKAGK